MRTASRVVVIRIERSFREKFKLLVDFGMSLIPCLDRVDESMKMPLIGHLTIVTDERIGKRVSGFCVQRGDSQDVQDADMLLHLLALQAMERGRR